MPSCLELAAAVELVASWCTASATIPDLFHMHPNPGKGLSRLRSCINEYGHCDIATVGRYILQFTMSQVQVTGLPREENRIEITPVSVFTAKPSSNDATRICLADAYFIILLPAKRMHADSFTTTTRHATAEDSSAGEPAAKAVRNGCDVTWPADGSLARG